MRQLFTWRFVAALAALAGLALLVNAVVADDDDALRAAAGVQIVERRIDLLAPVFSFERSDDFMIGRDGRSDGYLDMILDEQRVMRVAPGTPGDLECTELDEINRCVVVADLLGDAVVWFALVPRGPNDTVELPAIADLEEGDAVLVNGWRLAYPPVIERECGTEDFPSFQDFLRAYPDDHVSIVDLETQEVVAVRCTESGSA